MWWMAKIDLEYQDESRIVIPYDEELFADLCSASWQLNKTGEICFESKDEIKKKLGRSPNRGDSFVYWNWVRSRRTQSMKLLWGGDNA
jgi:hypothetical protein